MKGGGGGVWGGGFFFYGGAYLRGCLYNFETTMVSVLHEELEYKVEKLKYQTF